MVFLVACSKPPVQQIEAPKPQEHDFELIQLGSMRRDQYLLDRKTGTLWKNSCAAGMNGADCSYEVYLKVDVQDINGVTFESITANSKYYVPAKSKR